MNIFLLFLLGFVLGFVATQISYWLAFGRCKRFSSRHIVVGLLSGVSTVLCKHAFDDLVVFGFMLLFFFSLLVVSLVDFDTFLVPEVIPLVGIPVGLLSSLLRPDLTFFESLVGLFLGGATSFAMHFYYIKLKKVEGLGFGDVEVLAYVGAFTGPWGVLYALLFGSLLGLAYVLPTVIKHKNFQFAIPYVPFLSLGTFLGFLIDFSRFLLL